MEGRRRALGAPWPPHQQLTQMDTHSPSYGAEPFAAAGHEAGQTYAIPSTPPIVELEAGGDLSFKPGRVAYGVSVYDQAEHREVFSASSLLLERPVLTEKALELPIGTICCFGVGAGATRLRLLLRSERMRQIETVASVAGRMAERFGAALEVVPLTDVLPFAWGPRGRLRSPVADADRHAQRAARALPLERAFEKAKTAGIVYGAYRWLRLANPQLHFEATRWIGYSTLSVVITAEAPAASAREGGQTLRFQGKMYYRSNRGYVELAEDKVPTTLHVGRGEPCIVWPFSQQERLP